MRNLIEDLSALTTISKKNLNKLNQLSEQIIAHSVFENYLDKKYETEIDLGFGQLVIFLDIDSISYQFKPDISLDKMINESLIAKESPVVAAVKDNLAAKILNTYKELL